jgi:hypothetical protein
MRLLARTSWQRAVTAMLLVSFGAIAAACGDAATATTTQDATLDGAWTSRSSGVTSLLNLTWTRDSVKGAGTYRVFDNALGCGGGTLQGSGNVSFRASRSGTAITGVMAFDNGWTPPYTGVLRQLARRRWISLRRQRQLFVRPHLRSHSMTS